MEAQRKLKINQNQFSNFLKYIGKKQNIWSSTYIDEKNYLKGILKRWCKQLFNIEVISVIIWDKNRATLIVKYPKKYKNSTLLKPYENMINKFLRNLDKKITIYIADFSLIYENSLIIKEEILRICLNVIRTDSDYTFKPMHKDARKLINTNLKLFNSLDYKTIGKLGTKRISLKHKK